MLSLALYGLETAINNFLRLDPDAIHYLKKIEGKIIKIEITDWCLHFFIRPDGQGIQLLSDTQQSPDAVIRGTLFGLLRTGCAKATGSALFKNTIEIDGDTETGEILRDLLQKIDIDWEEHLSKLTGDILAHKIGHQVRKTIQFTQHSITTLEENIKEYLHEEVRYFPTSQQLEEFYQNIATLRDDVDRLEARINRILQKKAAR